MPLHRGFYSVKPLTTINPLELGSAAIHQYSYLSTESVLVQEGVIFQDVAYYTFCSSKTYIIRIKEFTYKIRQLKDEYLYKTAGIIDKKTHRQATVERAVADMLYFNPQFYFDAKDHVDWKRVEAIQKEAGYR